MASKVPHLLFKKTWVDFLKDEFSSDPKQTMDIFFAICDYAYNGILPEDPTLRLAIGAIRKEIDLDRQAYVELSETRRKVRLDAVERKKNAATNVDFVDDSTTKRTNVTNATNRTNGSNIIYNNISNSSSLFNDSELQDKKEKNKTKKQKTEIPDTAFNRWLKEKFPRIAKMDGPLTEDEYNKLVAKYGETSVLDKMSYTENYKDLLKKYVSAYLTINNWLKNGKSNSTDREGHGTKQDTSARVIANIFNSPEQRPIRKGQ